MLTVLFYELKNQLSTFTTYVVATLFLLASAWFLSFSDSQLNIFNLGIASIDTLFFIVPWLFLFLIPTSTMRFFAEEKKNGTIELLLTKPLTPWQLIMGKYGVVLITVLLLLLLSLCYLIVILILSPSSQSIDVAAVVGGYIGAFMLGAVFGSFGIFASVITPNSAISFIVSLTISFFFYIGFDGLAALAPMKNISSILLCFSVREHYDAMSRGILHSRDIVYFLSVIILFLSLTRYGLKQYIR